MIRQRRPFKRYSTPSWVVGRDFPDPNTRSPTSVPINPLGSKAPDPRRAGPPAPPTVRPPSDPSPQPPIPTPQNLRPPSEPSPQPPIAPQQNAQPQSEPSPQPAPPNPPKTREPAPQSPSEHRTSNYHSGKCTICNHPDRAAIEFAFLNWEPVQRLVIEFTLPSRTTVYRHAKAANLLKKRRANLLAALDHIIERAASAPATASSIISAIELSARLAGGNIAPLKRYEITYKHTYEPNPASDLRGGGSPAPPAVQPQVEQNPEKQSVHQIIVSDANSLIPKEGPPKQSVHIGGT